MPFGSEQTDYPNTNIKELATDPNLEIKDWLLAIHSSYFEVIQI